jgi:hypothetical protein
MQVSIVTPFPFVSPDVAYALDYSGRPNPPGYYVTEVTVKDQSAVKFVQGRSPDFDRMTILKSDMVEVRSTRLVMA